MSFKNLDDQLGIEEAVYWRFDVLQADGSYTESLVRPYYLKVVKKFDDLHTTVMVGRSDQITVRSSKKLLERRLEEYYKTEEYQLFADALGDF